MGILTVLSCISLVTTVVGLLLLGRKKASGFMVFTVSLLCQVYIFYVHDNKFLIFQMTVLIFFNIKNFLLWKKEEK